MMKQTTKQLSWTEEMKVRHLVLGTLVWVLVVLYPNPLQLARSVYRILQPPVNPELVGHLVAEAPKHPKEIEAFVLKTFPYQFDWYTYGMPWYFPTLEEALEQGTGDCKTRFIVLASIFEAKGIPHQLKFSLSHFWVHYEGKEENSWEMAQNAFLLREDDGSFRVQVPWEDSAQIRQNFVDGFWHAMPGHRKFLLLTGPAASLLLALFLVMSRKTGKNLAGKRAVSA